VNGVSRCRGIIEKFVCLDPCKAGHLSDVFWSEEQTKRFHRCPLIDLDLIMLPMIQNEIRAVVDGVAASIDPIVRATPGKAFHGQPALTAPIMTARAFVKDPP
jgi:hypothetical protein